MTPFPAWKPDAYTLSKGFAQEVNGVLPGDGGWQPWPALEALSLAVGAAIRGAYVARSSSGAAVIFAFTATKAYKFAGIGSSWTEVTRGIGTSVDNYATATDDTVMIDQFGDVIVATNGADEPQAFNLTSSTEFADLGGSPPTAARGVKSVGDHVWLWGFSGALGPTGIVPNGRSQINWSGFRDYDYWTLGEKSCSFASFPTGGFVQNVTTELAGLVFLDRQIWRFVKDPIKVFDFAPIQKDQGTLAPFSVVQDESDAYFYGTKGFARIGGSGLAQIGNEWVNEWFLEAINQARIKTIIGALDPVRKRIYWAYPGTSNASSYTRDGIICFDAMNQERPWTKADIQTDYIFSAATPGATLSDLASLYTNLAGIPFAIGSSAWLGGAPLLGAFDSANKLSFFTGNGIEATIQTGDFEPIPGQRFYVNGFRVKGDADAVTGRVAVKERPQDERTWKSSASLTAQGFIPARASGKVLAVETTIPAGEQWTFMAGIDFEAGDLRPDGRR